jgi:hypothetical protein
VDVFADLFDSYCLEHLHADDTRHLRSILVLNVFDGDQR